MENKDFELTEEELKSIEHLKPQAPQESKADRKNAILFTILYAVFGVPMLVGLAASLALPFGKNNVVAMGVVIVIALIIAIALGFFVYKQGAKKDVQAREAKNAEQEKHYQFQADVYNRALEGKIAEKKMKLIPTVCEFCGGPLDSYHTGVSKDESSYNDGFTLKRDYSSYSSTPSFTIKEKRVNCSNETGTEITYCKKCNYAIELDYSRFTSSGGFPLTTYKARRIMLRDGCKLKKEQVENGRLANWLPKP